MREIALKLPGCDLACYALPHQSSAIGSMLESHAAVLLIHVRPDDEPAVLSELACRAVGLNVPVVMICDADDPQTYLHWFRLGVVECLSRPLDLSRLALLVDSLTLKRRREEKTEEERNWLTMPARPPYCCGSNVMRELVRRAQKLAEREANVLITGETGTGKTHLAALIHDLSRRSNEPFIPVNCAAIPESLVESELFGHRRGAYTGADREQRGKFAEVGRGTLLLDEIDSLALPIQAKLLHAVENRVFAPLGGGEVQKFGGRLLTASNQALDDLVAEGRFRPDLFFRLNVYQLEIPPLRDRRCDIPLLADRCLEQIAARDEVSVGQLTSGALSAIEAYSWPGNVRELHNVLEQAVLLADDLDIDVHHLPPALRAHPLEQGAPTPTPAAQDAASDPRLSPLAHARRQGEVERIREALAKTGDNRTKAARELGISRAALYKKLKDFGLMPRPALD